MTSSTFKKGTKRFLIAQLSDEGMTEAQAYSYLAPKVQSQVRPWIFSANVKTPTGGKREAKPMAEQLVELKHEIARVYSLLGRLPSAPSAPAPAPAPAPVPEKEKPKAKGKSKDEEKRFFVAEWRRIRRWISDRALSTGAQPVDSLDTMRPVQAAKAAIAEGISAKAMLYSMCLHWSPDTRNAANVPTVDFMTEADELGEGFHKLSGYVLKLCKARIPVMLIGPAGTGKSHIAKQVAELLELPYGETPMTAGATPSWLLGRHTIEGFQPSQFLEIYSGGGVFNFEEIDAADPNMLIVVNNALASDRMFNPVTGEVHIKHQDFIPVSTANTFGLGANSSYTGRERLDLATIDRFRMGRVTVELDENLAELLMFG